MKHLHRILLAALAAFFYVGAALAQNAGAVTNHAFALGKGPGTQGYTSLLCTSAQLAVGQASADPICQTITGDVTIDATGATTIGATKVTSAMLNADVFSTAHSWSGQQTFTAPVLGTPASGTLTNATGLPISTGVSGLGTGVATFLGTPSSANLKAAVTDETGSGALVFATSPTLVTPALGTPSSGTLTNATGLPISTGVSGLGTGVATFLGTPSSANLRAALTDEVGTGAAYFVGGALGTPASGTATNLTGLPLTTGVTGTLPKANGGLGASTVSSALDTEFSATQGSVLYRNATQWVALAPGTAGQFLTTQGTGANPNWSSGGAGTGTVTSVTCFGTAITAAGTCTTAATKSNQQTGTSATAVVTPAHQQDHDSAAKAWCNFNGTTTGTHSCNGTSYNVTSVTRTSTGNYQINFTVPFADTNYACVGTVEGSPPVAFMQANSGTNKTTSSILMSSLTSFSATGDAVDASVVCFGRQ